MGSSDLQSDQTPVRRLTSIYGREQPVSMVPTVPIFANVDASFGKSIRVITLDLRTADYRGH
jgi:hypothetical protein